MLLAYPGAVTWQVIMQGVGSGMSAVATIVVGRVIDATFGTGHVAEILLSLGLLCALMFFCIAGATISMGMSQVGIARVVHNTRLFLTGRLLRSRDIRHSPGTILSTVDTDTKTCADVREITAFPVRMTGLSHWGGHRYRPHILDDRPAAARGCATDRRRRGTHREAHHQGIRGPPPGRGRTFWTCYRRRPRLSRG